MASLLSSRTQNPVAIVGGNRIPFARANRKYSGYSNTELFSAALDGLITRYDLAQEHIGIIAGGAVLKHASDYSLIRDCILNSRLDSHSPAMDIQQACATSLTAAGIVSDNISSGRVQTGIAGGTDTVSDAPIALSPGLRKKLLKINATQDWKKRLRLVGSLPVHLGLEFPRNAEKKTGLSMGEHQALTAIEFAVSRQEQDELALASHKKLTQAYEKKFFEDLITPYAGLERDDNVRDTLTLSTLEAMPTVFGNSYPHPTMTAGNSTALTDGAATVLLSTPQWAQEKGHKILAHFVDYETSAVNFVHRENGLLMAPTYAVAKLLERHKLTLQDFDFYEIHEAFASTVLSHLAAWDSESYCTKKLGLSKKLGSIDRKKLNVTGSSLATGHPFAATGARLVATLAKTISANNGGLGLISVCAAGGQGVAAIIEG